LSALASLSDNTQLSPFAQVLSTLQQLQQSNPTEYESFMSQIATNLTTAAQSATSSSTTMSTELTDMILAGYQGGSTSNSLNPMAIILNTLTSAGVIGSNS
jgi:hypothetical protein